VLGLQHLDSFGNGGTWIVLGGDVGYKSHHGGWNDGFHYRQHDVGGGVC